MKPDEFNDKQTNARCVLQKSQIRTCIAQTLATLNNNHHHLALADDLEHK